MSQFVLTLLTISVGKTTQEVKMKYAYPIFLETILRTKVRAFNLQLDTSRTLQSGSFATSLSKTSMITGSHFLVYNLVQGSKSFVFHIADFFLC